jgi:CheY-like chemotaxis protein
MNVLLVDDDSNFVLAARELMERQGHRIRIAGDGTEAFVLIREEAPDVVVLDFRMPGFNGAQTASVLRKAVPGIRIIGISALENVDTEWADAFLRKDYLLDQLGPLLQRFEEERGAET